MSEHSNEHKFFVKKKLEKAASLVPAGSKVLDIGCGDGKIREFLKNCIYFGVDIDKEAIDRLKNQIKPNQVKQLDLNISEIPFKEKFDCILLLDILEHITNPRTLLQKIKKNLKEQGKLIVSLPNDYHLLNKIRFIFNKHLTSDPFSPCGHLHIFPIKTGEMLFRDFKILQKYTIPPVKPSFIPQPLKNTLAKLFPQSFARDILYTLRQ